MPHIHTSCSKGTVGQVFYIVQEGKVTVTDLGPGIQDVELGQVGCTHGCTHGGYWSVLMVPCYGASALLLQGSGYGASVLLLQGSGFALATRCAVV